MLPTLSLFLIILQIYYKNRTEYNNKSYIAHVASPGGSLEPTWLHRVWLRKKRKEKREKHTGTHHNAVTLVRLVDSGLVGCGPPNESFELRVMSMLDAHRWQLLQQIRSHGGRCRLHRQRWVSCSLVTARTPGKLAWAMLTSTVVGHWNPKSGVTIACFLPGICSTMTLLVALSFRFLFRPTRDSSSNHNPSFSQSKDRKTQIVYIYYIFTFEYHFYTPPWHTPFIMENSLQKQIVHN